MMKQLRSLFLLCLLIPLLMSCESRTTIVSGLSENSANEILVYLTSKGIHASKVQTAEATGGAKKEVTFDIQVPSNEASEAMALLNQAGLPRPKGQSLLSIFKESSGLVPSEMQERIKKQAGTAEQIANTIRKIDGILDAEVLISTPEENPLSIEKIQPKVTASVFIKHNGVLDDPNLHLVSKIKRLVAASVPSLDYDNVTVIGTRARYSDFPLMKTTLANDEDKQFVSVWSIVIAKESLMTFRILFFSFMFFILILFLLLAWLIWKTIPLIKEHGGISTLFRLTSAKELSEEAEEETEKEKKESKKKEVKEDAEKSGEKDEESGPPSEVT